jgi:hypothetical protein
MPFPDTVTVFHGQPLPARARPAGYAALIEAYGLDVPLPRTLFAIGERHKIIEQGGWRLLSPRHAPRPTLEGHLTFALKHEGLDLAVLNRLFLVLYPGEIKRLLRAKPTGRYVRRIWFLYEWLTGRELDLPPLRRGSYVSALDPAIQFPGKAVNAPRQRVRNNLPGTKDFCPLVFRTNTLEQYIASDLSKRARAALADVPEQTRALVGDLFAMGEVLPDGDPASTCLPTASIPDRHRAIKEAGCGDLTLEEISRFQSISAVGALAAWPSLPSILAGMKAFYERTGPQLDPVIAAASIAFGFALAQPSSDPSKPVHRYLIQHVLAKRGFSPPGIVLPVSAMMTDRAHDYRRLFQTTVAGADADYHRFFDATPHAEFLYACVQAALEQFLPLAVKVIRCFERFQHAVESQLGLSEGSARLLFSDLLENDGRISERFNAHDIHDVTPEQARRVEEIFQRVSAPESK